MTPLQHFFYDTINYYLIRHWSTLRHFICCSRGAIQRLSLAEYMDNNEVDRSLAPSFHAISVDRHDDAPLWIGSCRGILYATTNRHDHTRNATCVSVCITFAINRAVFLLSFKFNTSESMNFSGHLKIDRLISPVCVLMMIFWPQLSHTSSTGPLSYSLTHLVAHSFGWCVVVLSLRISVCIYDGFKGNAT